MSHGSENANGAGARGILEDLQMESHNDRWTCYFV